MSARVDIDITRPRGEILTTRLCVERARACNRMAWHARPIVAAALRAWRDAWMRAARDVRYVGGEI